MFVSDVRFRCLKLPSYLSVSFSVLILGCLLFGFFYVCRSFWCNGSNDEFEIKRNQTNSLSFRKGFILFRLISKQLWLMAHHEVAVVNVCLWASFSCSKGLKKEVSTFRAKIISQDWRFFFKCDISLTFFRLSAGSFRVIFWFLFIQSQISSRKFKIS